MTPRRTARAVIVALLLLAGTRAAALTESETASVPRPFEPLRVQAGSGAVEIELWGRLYRFDAGPLPSAVVSQGTGLLAARPRFELRGAAGKHEITWEPPEVLEARNDLVRLRSLGTARGIRVQAETSIEYDGMVAVELALTAEKPTQVLGLRYELPLASGATQFFSRHLPYDAQADNVAKQQLLEAAGLLPDRLALDFVPTLALGDRRVGVEWWSETNAHWSLASGARPFEVVRSGAVTRLSVTPISAPLSLAPGVAWSDAFALFVFPSRPPPERWRSVRFLPYNRVNGFDSRIGTRFVFLATQANFHAKHDGLPASEDDRSQRELRKELEWKNVGYMPYGALMVAPSLHPTTMSHLEDWSTRGKWWRIYAGYDNPVIRRTHPELGVGAPYTYPVCAARSDYFDWMLGENLKALRAEHLDALYFNHGAITRMCVRNPALAGRPGRESWEYRNVREFYKRLYEKVQAVSPDALIVIHTHGTPKALGAFAHFHIFGEALNGFFGAGRPRGEYQANPKLYAPDYLALPDGHLDAMLFPPVGAIASVIPQIRWASEKVDPERVKGYQRAFQALVLSDDAHAPLWVSDLDTADELYRAVDRFGDLGDVAVHPWWSNEAEIGRPAGLRATAWVRGDRALLVLANLEGSAVRGRIQLDLAALGLPDARRVRDLEHPEARRLSIDGGAFEVEVPPRDLRILQVE
jgi:Glycoside hydrolase 123, N-terminal domain